MDFAIGLHSWEYDIPIAFGISLGAGRCFVELDHDLLARVGPAPDRQWLVALEHHVAANHLGQRYGGSGLRHAGRRDKQVDGNNVARRAFLHGGPLCLAGCFGVGMTAEPDSLPLARRAKGLAGGHTLFPLSFPPERASIVLRAFYIKPK